MCVAFYITCLLFVQHTILNPYEAIKLATPKA